MDILTPQELQAEQLQSAKELEKQEWTVSIIGSLVEVEDTTLLEGEK